MDKMASLQKNIFKKSLMTVQNGYKDKTIKNEVGTVVQIVPDTKIYEGDLEWFKG